MLIYASFKDYSEEYKKSLPEELFNQLIIDASKEIDKNINKQLTQEKINKLSGKAQEQLRYTACALVDLIERKKRSENRKLNSFSIDGVNKSFNNISNEEYEKSKKDILNNLPDELVSYV